MGIAKAKFNSILGEIFAPGNIIRLYTKTPNESDESGGALVTGTGVEDYEIKEKDFDIDEGEVISNQNMMLYLYEGEGASCDGFGVFDKSDNLQYFGKFDNGPLILEKNDVPAIKKYNLETGEGIKITMQSTEVSATTT